MLEFENGSVCLNAYRNQELQQETTQLLVADNGGDGVIEAESKIQREAEEGRIIQLAGREFKCLPSYGDTYRNTLLVIELSVRLGAQVEKDFVELYSCFFPNIKLYTHCDPNNEEEKANGVTCFEDPTPNFTNTFVMAYVSSWFQYDFMADAMEKNPDFSDGYIFMQEDVVLNFWNFPARHDFNKVWRPLMFADPDPDVWHMHMNMSLEHPERNPEMTQPYHNSPTFPIDSIRAFIDGFSEDQRQRLFKANSELGEPSFKMANSDCYHIPQKYREIVIEHFKRARKHILIHEVAVPVVLDALVPQEDYEELCGAALYRVQDSVQKIGKLPLVINGCKKKRSTYADSFPLLPSICALQQPYMTRAGTISTK